MYTQALNLKHVCVCHMYKQGNVITVVKSSELFNFQHIILSHKDKPLDCFFQNSVLLYA